MYAILDAILILNVRLNYGEAFFNPLQSFSIRVIDTWRSISAEGTACSWKLLEIIQALGVTPFGSILDGILISKSSL